MSKQLQKSETQGAEREPVRAKEAQTGCCGGAAPQGVDACCALDAEVKTAGGSGCGCASKAPSETRQKGRCC